MRPSVIGVEHSAVKQALPSGACDCHVHVFGPQSEFPMSVNRSYTPPEASKQSLRDHQASLGLNRVIIVQPSVYDTDNACTLEAVKAFGSGARGVAVVARNTEKGELSRLAEGGIVGIRLNMAAGAIIDREYIKAELEWAFRLTEPLGWHLQIFAELTVIAALSDVLASSPVPLVIDHYGRASAAKGLRQDGLSELLKLVASGTAYIKVSAPYLVSEHPSLSDVTELIGAFAAANSNRLLWGSNWPHPGGGTGSLSPENLTPFRGIDDGAALNRFADWVADDALMRRILVDNPATLFGFDENDGLAR